MAADLEAVKNRIRKMLRLAADSGAAEGEIQTALEGAQYLLAKHQLTEAELADEEQQPDSRTPREVAADCEYGTAKSWSNEGRAPNWQWLIAKAVAEFVGTIKAYQDRDQPRVKPSGIVANDGRPCTGFVFYGPADDCAMACDMHQELALACATLAKLKIGGSLRSGPARDYCDGFAVGLLEKVREARESMKTATARIAQTHDGGTRALTVVQVERANAIALAKQNRAIAWLKTERGINLRQQSSGGRRVGDSGAYTSGKADGRAQNMTTGNRPRRLTQR